MGGVQDRAQLAADHLVDLRDPRVDRGGDVVTDHHALVGDLGGELLDQAAGVDELRIVADHLAVDDDLVACRDFLGLRGIGTHRAPPLPAAGAAAAAAGLSFLIASGSLPVVASRPSRTSLPSSLT